MFYEVILDSGETPNKCTIAPLSARPDFRILTVKGRPTFGPLQSTLLLHHEGECLSVLRGSLGKVEGIASVDCVWKRLNGLVRRIEGAVPVLARIPEGFLTAYPRHSRLDTDPSGGLATIEALFVAAAMLGCWDPSLLSRYYFGRKFIQMNADRFLDLGVTQAADESQLPVLYQRPKTSLQRRLDRGKY